MLVVVGRRGGKTDEAGNWLVAGTAFDGLPGAALGPDYSKADYVFSGAWLAARNARMLDHKASSQYEGRLVLRRSVARGTGGIIQRRTADAKSGNVGFALRRVVWDEVCRTHHGSRVWGQDFRPTLADYHGEALWITTPAGWDHVHELHARIKAGREPDWGIVEAPSWLNHHVYPGGRNDPEILAIEKEYDEAGIPELFRQEYGAEFVVIEGLALRKWDHRAMIVPHSVALAGVNQFWLGYDWGWNHQTVFSLLGRTGTGLWRLLDEDYGTGEAWESILARCFAIVERNGLQPGQIERLYHDPSRPEQGAGFRIAGFNASAAGPYDIGSRLLALGAAMGKPGGWLVSDHCKRIPVEFSHYRMADSSSGKPQVVKVEDDGIDSVAGVLTSVGRSEQAHVRPARHA